MTEKSKKFILPVTLSVVFLVIGFGLGILYQGNHLRATVSNKFNQFQTGERLNDRTGNGTGLKNSIGSGAVFGEVTKMDDSSITVKTVDGSSKIILLSDTTVFNQSVSASKTDLKIGDQVRVDGATDSNTGSVTGSRIEINPARTGQNRE